MRCQVPVFTTQNSVEYDRADPEGHPTTLAKGGCPELRDGDPEVVHGATPPT